MRRSFARPGVLGACLVVVVACSRAPVAASGTNPAERPAAGSGAAGPAETTASGAPKRRDGWWEMTRFAADGSVIAKQQLCVGAGSEEKFSILTQINITDDDCGGNALTRTPTGWNFHAKCQVAVTKTEATGTISGDFRTSLRVDGTLVTDGQSDKMSVRGTWKGACPAGRKPGDLVNGDFATNVLG
jgi:hypothetical protein